MHPRVLELIRAHRTTIVFCNARRTAERLAAHLNELAGDELVRAHHGSLSREQRLQVESELKAAACAASSRRAASSSASTWARSISSCSSSRRVRCRGACSASAAPATRSASRARARSSRSTAATCSKRRSSCSACATASSRRCATRATRSTCSPSRSSPPTALDEWDVDDLLALVRRCANFADLSDDAFRETLDMLAGRYPSDQFAGLRPRVVWDRVQNRVHAREGAQRVAVASGGTIPDRGLFGVFLPDGARVGELDEEMVYESRVGECFVLGASTWRIEEITFDRVVVTPAPGEPAKTPFWKGDQPGRPLELGRALGALVARAARAARRRRGAAARASGLDPRRRATCAPILDEQAEATGAVPDDRTIVIERFADEIGDWRVCILTPFGARVHAPWALAIEERLARLDLPVQVLWSDDGIICRLPESLDDIPLDVLLLDPDELDELVVTRVPSTSLFASRFRENAARALLLPRRRPGERTPLWQQRQRAADLLEVASGYPTLPDPAGDDARVPPRRVRPARRSARCSPTSGRAACASSRSRPGTRRRSRRACCSAGSRSYMYEGDAPLAERRVAALALDRDLLRDLLGAEELRELLDPAVIAAARARAATARPGAPGPPRRRPPRPARRPRSARATTRSRRAARPIPTAWIDALLARAPRHPGRRPARRRRGRGPTARRARPGDPGRAAGRVHRSGRRMPLDDLVARYARTHVPFVLDDVAARLGVTAERAREALARLETAGRVVHGEFRPGGVEREWCDADVLRSLRRRSLAALRHEVEPVDAVTFVRFLSAWQGVGRGPARHRRAGRSARTAAGRRDPGRRCSNATCCRRASTATGRRCSTSCAPRASWCGSARARSAPTTDASACSSATA